MKKNLIIIGASVLQKPAYVKARKLGCNIISVDQDINAYCAKYADFFIPESFRNFNKVIKKIKKLEIKPDGIITCGVEASIYVSKIARVFKLKSISIKSSKNSTNKFFKSRILKRQKINVPNFYCTNKIIKKFKFPFVIKPTDSSGSRGVKLINDKKTFIKEFKFTKSISSNSKVFVEEFIKGKEYSLEGFMYQSKLYNTGLARRYYLPLKSTAPDFVEIEGVMPPPDLSKKKQTKLIRVFEKSALALGISDGPVKSDLIIVRSGKIYILEIASRSSSTFASQTQHYSNGTDCISANILWATGRNPLEKKFLIAVKNNYVSHCYYHHRPGVIKSLKLNKLKNKNIKKMQLLQKLYLGKKLSKINFMNRLFYIIVVYKNKNIRQITKKILSKITLT
ncbi:ATP-grasp domain-containing protein [Pelagibacterales bacterium SAG-MED48]|nr:ATP-grasp domain-containing protein [Pelagibacterales bacterium SAG-MED48]